VSDVFQPEQVVGGRYRVVRKLGGGGMADVYLCEDLTLGRHVAIKVLLQRYLDDPTFVERFRREAKAAAGLNQQNLVSIYDWGEVDGTYYIAMEYVEGETLKDLIRRRGRLSGNESVGLALQLLAAVDFAHRSGIVHRDIKPQNVMLDRAGTVKVMDFGIARAGDSGMTEAGSILGTAQYLAPEQAKGYPVDERSDLYSVGVVLYEMLTGTVPFKGDSAVTVALKHVNEMPREPSELVPGMPYALNQIVLKAMAKDPADRYQSASEFARDLRAAKEGGPVQAAAFDAGGERTRVMGAAAAGTTSVLDQPMPPRRKKSKWPLVLVIILLAIIAAVVVALWWTMSGNKVEVPGVVGLSRAAAVRALEKDGFKAGVQEEFSDRVAEGFVSRQAPTSGTKLREGATVDIWVSKGSQKASALPNFEGWTASAVDDWLSQNDLVGEPRTGRSSAVAEGQVFRQDPAPGTEPNRGDTVAYWISRGKPQATVPALTDLTQADAEAKLADAGLVGAVTQAPSTTVPAGSVISQDPAAGTKVDKGSTVSYVVSSGSPSPTATPTPTPSASGVSVPNVYGMQSTVAAQELTAVGLTVAYREKANTGQQPGTVVKIRPDAGTVVPAGSTVLLVIAA
jgi:beta-lactam-binding protein with PASTA domain/tRNA A-37 threonylcarbamoyl transferase component Bud32